VSEFPLSTPPARENFPRRNRIISGLSRGVLVVEADVMSGALITARLACDSHNRPVMAIPGRIDNAMSAGPHALIRDWAVLVSGISDVVENLGPLPEGVSVPIEIQPPPRPSTTVPGQGKSGEKRAIDIELADRQRRILEGIGDEPTALDVIIERCDLPAELVMQELTMLSLRGLVKRVEGQVYVCSGGTKTRV
jgi:DNA processing protein